MPKSTDVPDTEDSLDLDESIEAVPGDGDPVEDGADRPPGRSWLRPAVLVVVVAVLLVASGAVTAWLRISYLQSRLAAQDEVRDAAAAFALDLGSYDYRTMDGNFRLVRDNSTANFGDQLRQITDAMTPLLGQTQATSEGSVSVAGVVSADENRGVVIVFLDQTIKNSNTPQPRIDRSRMQLTVVKQDGLWKLDQVEAR